MEDKSDPKPVAKAKFQRFVELLGLQLIENKDESKKECAK